MPFNMNHFSHVITIVLAASLLLAPSLPSQAQILASSRVTYDPTKKDWASVISACLTAGTEEKRLFNFFTRAAFHDSLAVATVNCTTCGGADASLLLTAAELVRPENTNDAFAATAAKVVKRIANLYQVSVADALAICGAVSPAGLTKGDFDVLSMVKLRVGRLDSKTPNPAGQLPAVTISRREFADFWLARGFTIEEGVALVGGSHSLVDEQVCFRGRGGDPEDYCDPFKEKCDDVKMFQFDNHLFVDACTPSLTVPSPGDEPLADRELPAAEPTPRNADPAEYDSMKRDEMCKFTSKKYRWQAFTKLQRQRNGQLPPDPAPAPGDNVFWINKPSECRAPSQPGFVKANCPHPNTWMYTVLDGRLGMACQNTNTSISATDAAVKAAMLKYAGNNRAMQQDYAKAYVKMVSQYATWAPKTIEIHGRECFSGYASKKVLQVPSSQCRGLCPDPAKDCPAPCFCISGFMNGVARIVKNESALATPGKLITPAPAPEIPPPTADVAAEAVAKAADPIGKTPNTTSATPLGAIPQSPFSPTCVAADGQQVLVDGFPASPMVLTPFKNRFKNPPTKSRKTRKCRTDGHCMNAYEIDIQEAQLRPFDATAPYCATKPGTWFLTYDGLVPGPVITVPTGTENFVRFNNKIAGQHYELGDAPCDPKLGRPLGRPISVHLHGSASLPPYDGWAADETCTGESKDYIYPSNRATTLWYHDHALDITAQNAYAGLAGMYIVSDDSRLGSGCRQPFNLDGMEERLMMISDKVLDSECQLRYDKAGRHHNSLYGDVILVSGTPWPRMPLQPKWYRFRFLNTGPSRPYLIKLKDDHGRDVAQDVCWVVAGDGGWRQTPTKFPDTGMFLGVAERYEVVCDFSKFAGKALYFWNDRDDKIMKDVPMFCHTHLIARVEVAIKVIDPQTSINFQPVATIPQRALKAVFDDGDLNRAIARAKSGNFDRKFVFGRRKSHWVINGEDWHSFRIAAKDVGQNSWELWLLKTGGGWFHPIHIHLIDFFIVQRDGPGGVRTYEQLTPKDVVFLGPSQKIWVVARFGAHRGDYMFHCHNLVHEDDAMMRAFSVVNPSKGKVFNQGTQFTPSKDANDIIYNNWGYNNPEFGETSAKLTALWPAVTEDYIQKQVDKNLHRIFYPLPNDPLAKVLNNPVKNPWKQQCPLQAIPSVTATLPPISTTLAGAEVNLLLIDTLPTNPNDGTIATDQPPPTTTNPPQTPTLPPTTPTNPPPKTTPPPTPPTKPPPPTGPLASLFKSLFPFLG